MVWIYFINSTAIEVQILLGFDFSPVGLMYLLIICSNFLVCIFCSNKNGLVLIFDVGDSWTGPLSLLVLNNLLEFLSLRHKVKKTPTPVLHETSIRFFFLPVNCRNFLNANNFLRKHIHWITLCLLKATDLIFLSQSKCLL